MNARRRLCVPIGRKQPAGTPYVRKITGTLSENGASLTAGTEAAERVIKNSAWTG